MSLSVRESGIHVSLPTIDPTVNSFWGGRYVAIATDSFLGDMGDFFINVAQAIGTFFAHRFADMMMFGTAFGYMATTATTSADIDRYIQQLSTFANAMNDYVRNYQNAGAGAADLPAEDQNLRNAFYAMSDDTKALLYQVDARLVNRMIFSPMAQKVEYCEEIVRECQVAIAFQNNLKFINDFFHWCCGDDKSSGSATSPSIGSSTTATGSDTAPVVIFPPAPVTFPIVPEHEGIVIVNVPGTARYVRGNIPADVQRKADEIARLRDQFDALPGPHPAIPEIYNDAISGQDFMLIPVFDASHRDIQTAMVAACRPGISERDADIARLNNRVLRHIYDAESLEQAYSARGPYGALLLARCPACRHPEADHRQVDRSHLRIDTALQDEILTFLRTHVPAAI